MSLFKLGYNLVKENSIDKALVILDKPIDKILNKDITLYHGTKHNINSDVLTPMSPNVGATKYSIPRWSTYFWDNRELAIKWCLCWSIGQKDSDFRVIYVGQNDKVLLYDRTGIEDKNKLFDKILKSGIRGYLYTCDVPISKLEIGSVRTINEYTVSDEVKIKTKEVIKPTRDYLNKYFEVISGEEYDYIIDDNVNILSNQPRVRGFILDKMLNDYRDYYRREIKLELKSGKIKVGDDISYLKGKINELIKNDGYSLRK